MEQEQNKLPEVQKNSSQPKQKLWLKKYGPIVVIVATIVVLTFLAFSVFDKKEIDTSSWKIHEDAEFGFQLMYPESFEKVPLSFSLISKERLSSEDYVGRDRESGIKDVFESGEYTFYLYDYTASAVPTQQRTEAYVSFDQGQYLVLRNSFVEKYEYGLPDINLQELKEILKTFRFFEDRLKLWDTYRNDEHGFELRYPSSWDLSDASTSTRLYIHNPDKPPYSQFSLRIFDKDLNQTIDDEFETNGCGRIKDGVVSYDNPCVISNLPYKTKNYEGREIEIDGQDGGTWEYVLFEKNNKTYVLSSFMRLHEMIISFFKFIDSETENLQTYSLNGTTISLNNPVDTTVIKDVKETRYLYTGNDPYLHTYTTVKIIPTERAEKLGQKDCYYGERGILEICNAADEFGVSFGVVTVSADILVSKIDKNIFPIDKATVLGKEVVMYTTGIEGYSDTTYFVPLEGNFTLLINRKDYDQNPNEVNEFDVFPSSEEFEKILSSLRVTN